MIPIWLEAFAAHSFAIWWPPYFPLGWSGEGGVTSAGAGQDFVKTWHEETPQNSAHVLWAALPWPDESLWASSSLCSQGNFVASEKSTLFYIVIMSSLQDCIVWLWLIYLAYLQITSLIVVFFYLFLVGRCGHEHSWDLHYHKWDRVCHWLRICKAAGLQSPQRHRITGGHTHLQGLSQPESRKSRAKPSWEMLPAVHRYIWVCRWKWT